MSEQQVRNKLFNLDRVMLIFFRVVALVILAIGLHYWALLVGFVDDSVRFDTLLNHWRIAATVLGVLMPIAVLGLWGMHNWGFTIWILVIAIELSMYNWLPNLFGEAFPRTIFHIVCFAVFVLYQLARFLESRRVSA